MAETNITAVIEGPHAKPLKIVERPIPTPGPGELVIRNHAIAANPIDWKIQDYNLFINQYPNVLGSDSCGVVTAVGSGVTLFKVGDRATGFAGSIKLTRPWCMANIQRPSRDWYVEDPRFHEL
jgi:NADPH:quinone reductase-like Zn-dependent oxidoreductase